MARQMQVFLWICCIGLTLVLMLGAFRFYSQRSQGAPVVLRKLPAQGVHRWRHGSFRYNGNDVEYYKLRSLFPMADAHFNRLSTTVLGRRSLTPEEASFLSPDLHVVNIKSNGAEFELALAPNAEGAFTAWLEAAPSARQDFSVSRQDFLKLSGRDDTNNGFLKKHH